MVARILHTLQRLLPTGEQQQYENSPSVISSSSPNLNGSSYLSPAANLRSSHASTTATTIISEDNNTSSSSSNDNVIARQDVIDTFQQFFIGQGNNKQDSKGTKLSTVFYKWYSCEWHLLQLETNTKAKALHSQVWKTVMHLQRYNTSEANRICECFTELAKEYHNLSDDCTGMYKLCNILHYLLL